MAVRRRALCLGYQQDGCPGVGRDGGYGQYGRPEEGLISGVPAGWLSGGRT